MARRECGPDIAVRDLTLRMGAPWPTSWSRSASGRGVWSGQIEGVESTHYGLMCPMTYSIVCPMSHRPGLIFLCSVPTRRLAGTLCSPARRGLPFGRKIYLLTARLRPDGRTSRSDALTLCSADPSNIYAQLRESREASGVGITLRVHTVGYPERSRPTKHCEPNVVSNERSPTS